MMKIAVLLPLFMIFTAGCAASSGATTTNDGETNEVRASGTPAERLTKAMEGIVFQSEGDSPWFVLEADGEGVATFTADVVVARLSAPMKTIDERDLGNISVRRNDASKVFDELADGAEPEEVKAYRAAKKIFAEETTGLAYFTFDEGPSGDQDTGPIIHVIVGKTKADKLVAMVTFQVAT